MFSWASVMPAMQVTTVNVATAPLVIAWTWLTVSVKVWLTGPPTPLDALTVNG